MKTLLCHLVSFASIGLSFSADPPRFERSTKMRDAARHEDLAQKLKMSAHHDPIRSLGPAIGNLDEDPAKRVTGRDLVKESTVLNYRGFLTLVPKRAVIHTPANYEDRFKPSDEAKVQSWADFFKGNRGWIRTLEVSREQAMGLAPMDEAVMTALQEGSQVVVATFKGGPISVMPYVAPETEETDEPTDSGEARSGKTAALTGEPQNTPNGPTTSSKP